MRSIFFLGIFAFLIPIVFHGEQIENNGIEKAYVQPEQIVIDSQGIFAYIDGGWIPVESICFDANGVYAKYHNPHHGRWRCPRCGFSNNPWDNLCQNVVGDKLCLTPRPE